MGRQIHAQLRNTNRPEEKRKEFQGKELVTRKLRIKGSGKEFTGIIPKNAGVEKAIEMIAEQNGGEVKKRYYEEMGAYEITEICIEDQLITKDKTGGIHWFIDDNKIPVAVDKEGRIAFLNGEEVSIDKSEIISVGLESSTADPKTLKDLRGNRQKVESAHATAREKEVDIENSEVILFDKETGELSPMQKTTEAESFDYGEISMEKIFVSQISAVENNSAPVYETDNNMLGEIFFSYIEIVNAKESILDRISFVAEPVEEIIRQEVSTVEPAAEQTSMLSAESFSVPMTKVDYTSQSEITTDIYTIPKRKEVFPPPVQYFQIPKPKGIRVPKKEPKRRPKPKLINYTPKIEKIGRQELKKPEKYPPQIETTITESPKYKIKHENLISKSPKIKTRKRKARKKKRRKRKTAEHIRKTISKIKKTKKRIQKLLKPKKPIRKKVKTKVTTIKIKERARKKKKKKIGKKTKKRKQEPKISIKKEKIKKRKVRGKKKKTNSRKKLLKRKKKIVKYLLTGYF